MPIARSATSGCAFMLGAARAATQRRGRHLTHCRLPTPSGMQGVGAATHLQRPGAPVVPQALLIRARPDRQRCPGARIYNQHSRQQRGLQAPWLLRHRQAVQPPAARGASAYARCKTACAHDRSSHNGRSHSAPLQPVCAEAAGVWVHSHKLAAGVPDAADEHPNLKFRHVERMVRGG